jgi:hypothetical protein
MSNINGIIPGIFLERFKISIFHSEYKKEIHQSMTLN